MSRVFHRSRTPFRAVRAEGAWIIGADGRRYLDGSGGAIVNGVGHGRVEVAEAIADQLKTLDFAHNSVFTSDTLEEYATEVAKKVPVVDARVFPVSGGSEATETALKLARVYHLDRGEPQRTVVLSRHGSYHGNTLGALDASGRVSPRVGYEPWLGRFDRVPWVNEYRCPNPRHPDGCGVWHADTLEAQIVETGPDRVAAFVGEPIGGATLGAAVPSDDYWPAVAEVCARHGVLLIVDEVMSGFGRSGRWFGIEHWGVGPDIMICAKGASSGYWPLGLCVASAAVAEAAKSFAHGFTYSHHPAGAAAGLAVMRILEREALVERAAASPLLGELRRVLIDHPRVGDVRGKGLMIGIELVADRETKAPFRRAEGFAERVRAAAFDTGLLVYPVTGCADGVDGDGIMLGPPLDIGSAEIDFILATLPTVL